MNGLNFAHGWMLFLLPLVFVALAAWWWGTRRAANRARAVSRARGAPPPYAAAIIFSLAAAAGIVTAAQPRWGTHESRVPRTGSDLVVVVDISRSMDARDVAPSRLQASKDVIDTILNRLGGDRVGLVVFAGEARVRFPLTTDFSAARQVVGTLQTGVVFVKGGSSAGLGLEEAVTLLSNNPDSGKVILLLTDGDDLGGDPATSALKVRDSGADLLIAGVGTSDGSTIPVVDNQRKLEVPKLDAQGQPIVTKLNEPFLRSLAAAAGGRYLGSDLSIVAGAVDGRLRALERSQIEVRPTVLPIERYRYFASTALGLLVLACLAERFGRFPLRASTAFAAFAALGLFAAGCATEAYEANEQGRAALERGENDVAIDKFLEVQVQRPDDPRVALNLAAAYAAAQRFDEAILSARRALDTGDSKTRSQAYSSIGHHLFSAERLTEALDAFRRALLEDPENSAARHDYEVVLRKLFPELQPTPPPGGEAGTPTPNASVGNGNGGAGGTPTPGAGTPTPGSGGQGQGTPTPASPSRVTSVEQLDRQLRDINQQVNRLLEDAGDAPTASQALEILRLLAERSRLASVRDALTGGGGPRDY